MMLLLFGYATIATTTRCAAITATVAIHTKKHGGDMAMTNRVYMLQPQCVNHNHGIYILLTSCAKAEVLMEILKGALALLNKLSSVPQFADREC